MEGPGRWGEGSDPRRSTCRTYQDTEKEGWLYQERTQGRGGAGAALTFASQPRRTYQNTEKEELVYQERTGGTDLPRSHQGDGKKE